MGNPKKQHPNQGRGGKTSATKSVSLTRLFRDSTDHDTEAAGGKMAATERQTVSPPAGPARPLLSAQDTAQEADISTLLKNLSSRADLAAMLSKLETTFQSKMEAMNTDIT
ncbi:Hypothetical predicted protein, partial [Pelobates cultripes]